MSKRKDKAGIIVRKRWDYGGVILAPVSPYDAECLDRYPFGEEFNVEPRTRRSLPQQRLYWATLNSVVKATGRWPTSDKLHDALVRACGFVEVNYGLDGIPYVTRDSTSFDAMSADEFKAYMDHAMEKLAEAIGYDPLSASEAA